MQFTNVSWTSRKIDYELSREKKPLLSKKILFTDYHPLKPILVTGVSDIKSKGRSSGKSSKSGSFSEVAGNSSEFFDPLSALTNTDPLSQTTPSNVACNEEVSSGTLKSWNTRKFEILSEYSFDESVSAQMVSVLRTGEKLHERNFPGRMDSEQINSKLRSLNNTYDSGSVSQNVLQRQFVDKIYESKKSLKESWEANQKVNALKTAIQCSKMLGNISTLQYYPSKFVLVADILEIFGQLVFERILSMCSGMSPENINPEKVPENAKEICLNWIMKVSSIRELLPRILMEASILPCLKFLPRPNFNSVLVRLTNMTKGIGDPLVAIYIRAYLCIIGMKYTSSVEGYVTANYHQFIETYKQILTSTVQKRVSSQKMKMISYMNLYVPALEWILSCIASKATENVFHDVMQKLEKTGYSLMLLKSIYTSFHGDFITPRASEICSLVTQSSDEHFSKAIALSAFGKCAVNLTFTGKDKKSLLAEAWKFISTIQDAGEYMDCAVPWAEYAAKNCGKKEVNAILGDIVKHLSPDRIFEKHYLRMLSALKGIMRHMTNFAEIFSMDKLLVFLDMFQQEDSRLQMCDLLVADFVRLASEMTSDQLVINGMMYVCKGIHESVSSLTPDSDKKSFSALICSVLHKITFGKDFEQQLDFYVDCRATFYKLDPIQESLVHLVNSLAATTSKIVKHRHTSKTSAFVRACAAFSYITIPSIGDPEIRLRLYLVSGQAALINQCIAQADAMFYGAITQVKEVCLSGKKSKTHLATVLYPSICNLLSCLLAVPDRPDQGMLYLLRGLLNIPGDSNSQLPAPVKMRIFIKGLSLLSAYSQEKFIYQVDNVDSNEHLYSGDLKFKSEITKMSTALLDAVLKYLETESLKSIENSTVAIELLSTIIACADTTNPEIENLAVQVWKSVAKIDNVDKIMMKKLLQSRIMSPAIVKKISG